MAARKPSVHFVGICGTAMGNVAAMMHDEGWRVTGSDANVYPPMSTFLAGKGIQLMSGFKPENVAHDPALCVVGNAISRGNPELEEILNRKLRYESLPAALREHFLQGTHNLVVAGTHGKTTTSSMLAWIFDRAGREPSFLIGGLPANFGTGCRRGKGPWWILEGDEYDTAFFDKRSKFLHYLPELAVINNIEFDHADIYPDLAAIQRSFRLLVNLVPSNGMLIVNADDPNAIAVTDGAPCPITSVGLSPNAGVRIRDWAPEAGGARFRLFDTEFRIPLHGEFNVRNAAMAATVAHFYQIPLPAIADALARFEGVRRRQEVRAEIGGVTVIDDFGHHPTAMRETLAALRVRYRGRRIWALFEPRSNTTRRAVFQKELPRALALADGVIVAEVARLEQLPEAERLDPARVVADIQSAGRPAYYEKDAAAIVARLAPLLAPGDVITVFSNGGFGGIHGILEAALRQRFANPANP